MRVIGLTTLAMVFFAANSVLARLALRESEIDGGTFTAVRICSGALTLALLVGLRDRGLAPLKSNGTWSAAAALFGYAIAFSLAYLTLDAGVGALILFASVQITMITVGVTRGERPEFREWAGLGLAMLGLVYLVSPGLAAPSLLGSTLMAASGIAWGCYSLAARGVDSPMTATAGNFVKASPMAALVLLVTWALGEPHASWAGVELGILSGAITSGLGYVIWYLALESLSTSRAAIVQLTVPVIAAAAGVLFLGEQLTARLGFASIAILGGVALALTGINRINRRVEE